MRSFCFTFISLFLMVTLFQSVFADQYLIEMLRACPVGAISVDPDGICINTLNVDFLSAGDVSAESLSVADLLVSGNLSAGTITADLSGNATTATTAIDFSGSLIGDVTGTQGATVTSAVGGQTAANVAAATVLANAATSANTVSAIVKRDSSGNFSAGTITASLMGNATTATTATNFSGSLVGDVTGTQGATVVSTVGGQTAANIAAGAVLANAGTSANTVSTLVLRNGSGNFSASAISMTDGIHSGNLVLSADPSTSTTGNIMKGSNRFIHNYGTNNTFIGVAAGNFTTSGSGFNSALGASALTANTTGTNNTALGYNALNGCTTGSNNIAIGSGAGTLLTTGSGNIYISNSGGTASESNSIRIGTSGTQSTCFIQGIRGVSLALSGLAVVIDTNGQLGTTLSSEKLKHNIKDMNDVSSGILALRPVTFTYKNDTTDTEQFGLIAEEVEKVFPAIVVYDEDGNPLSVQYHILPVLLLNEIKKQRNMIGDLYAKTNDLKVSNHIMIEAIAKLQEKIALFMDHVGYEKDNL